MKQIALVYFLLNVYQFYTIKFYKNLETPIPIRAKFKIYINYLIPEKGEINVISFANIISNHIE